MLAATPRWATLPTSRPFHRSLYDEYAPAYDSTPQGRQFEAMDVSRNTSSAAHAVVNASRITGAAHLIPEEPSPVGATTTSHSKREQNGSGGSTRGS
jgi:hypothetical protein